MICPNCKKELADNANACPECGYSFIEQKLGKNTVIGCGCTLALLVGTAIIVGLVIYSVVS